MFPKEVYAKRRENLKSLVNKGVGLFLANPESPMNCPDNTFHFRQDSSFLYFFGIKEPGLAAVIDFESGEEILFGDDISIDAIIWMGELPSIKEKAASVAISKTQPYSSLAGYVEQVLKQGRQVHYLPPYRAENTLLLEELLKIPAAQIQEKRSLELVKAVIQLRSVKDELEIAEIEKACHVGYEMHTTAMRMAIEGTWEQKISGTIEGIPIQAGGHYSFPVILSQNGQILHNHNHNNILEKGRLMLVDCGAETAMGYASDFTRTTPVGGIFTAQQKEIYQIVLNANNKATELSQPGVTYKSVHLEAARVIAKGLKEVGLMKGDVDAAVAAGAHALFFPHGLGHMMGLDVHDMEDLNQVYVGFDEEVRPSDQFGLASLRLGRKLEEGFVITNEPGIYFIPALIDQWQGEKLHSDFINYEKVNQYRNFGGIRLEDDLLITNVGSRILGKRVPITPDEVELIAGTGI